MATAEGEKAVTVRLTPAEAKPKIIKPVVSDLGYDAAGTPFRETYNKTGDLLVRIEYYIDSDPQAPKGFKNYLDRMAQFYGEMDQWKTVVTDSVTFLGIAARKYEQYVKNPKKKGVDPRQWYGGAADAIEEEAAVRLGSLPMNVVLTCHVGRTKDDVHGDIVRLPDAPGRLAKGLPAAFSEVYHSWTSKDGDGKPLRMVQTQSDDLYAAETHIDAPDPSWNDYSALWDNYIGVWDDKVCPIHCLLYGDFGAGKTHMAATFPKPMLVLFFDGHGKDSPYLRVVK